MIHIAIKEALKSNCRYKHGAVIAKGGCVITKGYNKKKEHPRWGGGHWNGVHAEADAIRKALSLGVDLSKCVLYIARHNKGISKPCPDCAKLIKKYNIKKVVFTKRSTGAA